MLVPVMTIKSIFGEMNHLSMQQLNVDVPSRAVTATLDIVDQLCRQQQAVFFCLNYRVITKPVPAPQHHNSPSAKLLGLDAHYGVVTRPRFAT
jgi:hypothetical protein